MIEIILIVLGFVLFLTGLVFLGLYLKSWQVRKIIKERDNLDLSIPENITRLDVLNRKLDRIYYGK